MNFFERVEMKRLVYVFAMAIAIPVNSNAGIVINGAIAAGGAVALAAKSRIKCEPVDPSFSANSGRGGACRDCDYSISSSNSTTTVLNAVPTFFTSSQLEAITQCNTAGVLVLGEGAMLRNVNTSAYLGWSAEL